MNKLKDILYSIDNYIDHNYWLVPAFLLSIFIVVLVLVATIPDPKPTNKDTENVKEYIVKMNYEGHSYLLYKRLSATAICHDENCKCKER